VSSNQASRNGAGRANSISGRLAGLLRTIGASAIALALCAIAQSASASPGAAAAQNAPPAALGASIRKTPGAAATGGAPAAADNTGAASPAAAPAASDAAATASSTAPGAMESAGVPAALSTPSAHAKGKTRTKTKTRTRTSHGAGSSNATRSASAKTDSNDTNADSQDGKDSKGKDSPFSSLQFSGNKGPIDIKSDALDLDYKGNVVTFRGHVHAAQADALLTSDTLTVTYGKDFHEVKEMVANDNVRMSQGTRWATGDHAVLDQAKHTVTLTGSPVVHDGEDQVTGSKITVHLDTGKSVVEGARAVFFPKEQKTRDNKTTAVAKSPNKTTVAKSP
jgi:lipopolysaccharide export system protein LptA